MSKAAFQVPESERFSFSLPGESKTYSIPVLLDLPEEKIVALVSLRGYDASNMEELSKFTDLLVSLGDDEETQEAIRLMSLRQKTAFAEAYLAASEIEPGESQAS